MRLSESKRTDARPEEKTSKQYVPLHHVKVTLLQQHLRNCWNEEGGKPTPTILVHWLDPLARPTGSTHCQTTAKPLDFNRPRKKKEVNATTTSTTTTTNMRLSTAQIVQDNLEEEQLAKERGTSIRVRFASQRI